MAVKRTDRHQIRVLRSEATTVSRVAGFVGDRPLWEERRIDRPLQPDFCVSAANDLGPLSHRPRSKFDGNDLAQLDEEPDNPEFHALKAVMELAYEQHPAWEKDGHGRFICIDEESAENTPFDVVMWFLASFPDVVRSIANSVEASYLRRVASGELERVVDPRTRRVRYRRRRPA